MRGPQKEKEKWVRGGQIGHAGRGSSSWSQNGAWRQQPRERDQKIRAEAKPRVRGGASIQE